LKTCVSAKRTHRFGGHCFVYRSFIKVLISFADPVCRWVRFGKRTQGVYEVVFIGKWVRLRKSECKNGGYLVERGKSMMASAFARPLRRDETARLRRIERLGGIATAYRSHVADRRGKGDGARAVRPTNWMRTSAFVKASPRLRGCALLEKGVEISGWLANHAALRRLCQGSSVVEQGTHNSKGQI
jgi:hypothetical protein